MDERWAAVIIFGTREDGTKCAQVAICEEGNVDDPRSVVAWGTQEEADAACMHYAEVSGLPIYDGADAYACQIPKGGA